MSSSQKLDVLGMDSEAHVGRRASHLSQALRSIPADESDLDESNLDPHVEVRPVRGASELDSVHRITHDAYAERGYCSIQPDRRLIHYPHLERIPETTVLVAIRNGVIAGTISWTVDGSQGLHADADFAEECNAIRAEGRKLAASWRIVTTSVCRNERRVLMALIQEAVRSEIEAGVMTSVFTFNPRHERIYQRLLNMRTIARRDQTRGLHNAPAVLMRLDREAVPERWLSAMTVG